MDASSEAQQSRGRRLFSAIIFHPIAGKSLLILLGILPGLLLLRDIQTFSVNVPFMDDWQFVPLLQEAKNGTLTFQKLWAPHDEHRLLLPRIIIIASMFATGWDYRVQSLITFWVVAIISVCLLWLMIRLEGNRNSVFWAWALANIALFSPIQFHNWLWPMQFAYFLPYMFLVLCFCALYARIPALPKFLLAAVFALAGNWSFVQGNLIWPAALPVILYASGILCTDARRNFAIAWLATGALAVTLYFWGLEQNSAASEYAYGHDGIPPTMSTLRLLQEQPANTILRMGRFILGMFGNAVARGLPVADNLLLSYISGAILLLLALVAVAVAWKRGLFFNRALPWTCFLVFAFLTAAFVCIGRVWRGDSQPLTPRYTTFGAFCIVSLIALLSSAFSGAQEEFVRAEQTSTSWSKMLGWMQGILVGLYLCLQGVNWTYGHSLMEEWSLTRWRARAKLHFLRRIPSDDKPYLLGGRDEVIEEMVRVLESLGMLNPSRASDLRISALGREVKAEGLKRGRMDSLIPCGLKGWRASGFALATAGRSADAVVLGVQNSAGEWVAVAATTPLGPPQYLRKSTRMDLEFLAVSEPRKRGEWKSELPLNTFQGSGVLRAWAMDFRRRILYRLPDDQKIIVSSSNEPEAEETDQSQL
jgi:hypothetical protein